MKKMVKNSKGEHIFRPILKKESDNLEWIVCMPKSDQAKFFRDELIPGQKKYLSHL